MGTGAPHRVAVLGLVLALGAVAGAVLGAGVGSTGLDSLLHWRGDAAAQQIVWEIRLPRTLGAWLAGLLLGLAGAVAQGLLRNPLADPFLLGSASGAGLGVALALAFGAASTGASQWLAALGLTGAAFAGALAGVLLTLVLARGAGHSLRLLLAGVVVGVVLGAAREAVTLIAPDTLQPLQGFMLGSTAFIGWPGCVLLAGIALPCLVVGWALARVLDALALGEATAASLGLPLGPAQAMLVGLVALATGAAVAQTGLVAFVGLAAPHLVRSLVTTTHRAVVVLSGLAGGLLLLAADLLARGLVAPGELPVGILTAVLGGSYLLWLMHHGAAGGGRTA